MNADESQWVERDLLRQPVPPPGVRIRSEWDASGLLVHQWIHRDDYVDPDAELIATLAAEFNKTWCAHREWDAHYKTPASVFTALAEKALAVVRESEGRP